MVPREKDHSLWNPGNPDLTVYWGFPDGSHGKASACDVGDPGLIPGSRRSPGEDIGYPLQYYWVSAAAQSVKTLAVIQETWV